MHTPTCNHSENQDPLVPSVFQAAFYLLTQNQGLPVNINFISMWSDLFVFIFMNTVFNRFEQTCQASHIWRESPAFYLLFPVFFMSIL